MHEESLLDIESLVSRVLDETHLVYIFAAISFFKILLYGGINKEKGLPPSSKVAVVLDVLQGLCRYGRRSDQHFY